MESELVRLQAALATIHDHLHAGRINEAHEACECAMSGEAVSQPNLSMPQTARIQKFAHSFNELCKSLDIDAAFLALLPSASKAGYTSMQIGGAVRACKVIESSLGKSSTYQGEHGTGRRFR